VKPQVFDGIVANLSFLSGNYILLFTKGREEGKFLSYNPPELVQQTEGHLCTGGVCSHAGWLRKPLDQMPRQYQK
jgi:hypothetical protein